MTEWWRGAIIYQICPASFAGNLTGLAEKLPYVASLGVDAVWITPFYASPMQDFGYDVADYRTVDPRFGTLADFDRVVDVAHRLGLKVILDQVWSHSSDRHPWFRDRPDFYVWADPRPDGGPPNNWLSVFGGPAWSWDPRRRQYYLHHFLPAQPAFDWRNPEVAEQLFAVGEFWRARGVDGFRLDAVDFLLHDPGLPDNPARPLAEVPAKPFGMQEHRFDMAQPAAMDIFAAIRRRFPATFTMAELSSSGDPIGRAALYTSPGHLDTAYTLGLMRRPFTAAGINDALAKVPGGGLAWAFSNHDVVRAASRWGDGSGPCVKLMLALLSTLPGTVCLYQGEELGLPEVDLPFEKLQDPYGLAFWPEFKGRDGCRTPMPWAPGDRSEPVHHPLAVAVQERDDGSVLNTARRLLHQRRNSPALRQGSLTLLDLGAEVVAFDRATADETVRCVFNLSPAPAGAAGLALDGWGYAFRFVPRRAQTSGLLGRGRNGRWSRRMAR